MLNEIFKGMDNASEAINENFLFGSIIEEGENEKGHYVKFGSGLALCFIYDMPVGYEITSRLSAHWAYPISMAEVWTVVGVRTAFDGGYSINNVTLGVTRGVTEALVRFYGRSDFVSTDVVGVNLIAVGRWK